MQDGTRLEGGLKKILWLFDTSARGQSNPVAREITLGRLAGIEQNLYRHAVMSVEKDRHGLVWLCHAPRFRQHGSNEFAETLTDVHQKL